MRIAVLGAGSWGTTLANLLAQKGEEVRLWAYEAEVVDSINAAHRNELFLPDAPLAPGSARDRRSRRRPWRGPTWWCPWRQAMHSAGAAAGADRSGTRHHRRERHQGAGDGHARPHVGRGRRGVTRRPESRCSRDPASRERSTSASRRRSWRARPIASVAEAVQAALRHATIPRLHQCRRDRRRAGRAHSRT